MSRRQNPPRNKTAKIFPVALLGICFVASLLVPRACDRQKRLEEKSAITRELHEEERKKLWERYQRIQAAREADRKLAQAAEARKEADAQASAWTATPCDTSAKDSYRCDGVKEANPSHRDVQAAYRAWSKHKKQKQLAKRQPSQANIDRYLWEQEEAKAEFRRSKALLESETGAVDQR